MPVKPRQLNYDLLLKVVMVRMSKVRPLYNKGTSLVDSYLVNGRLHMTHALKNEDKYSWTRHFAKISLQSHIIM